MAKTEDILLRIGADASGLRKEVAAGRKDLKGFEDQVGSTVGKLGMLAATLGLGLGFSKLIAEALEFADTITRVADQTGLSTDAVQRLNFIASQTGTTLDQITGGVGKMQKNLVSAADGGKAAADALELLGVDAVQFLKLNPDEQFTKAAEAIASIQSPAQKTASAIAIFGKAGADLLPTLDAIGKHANELNAKFEKMGGPVSAEAIKAVDALGDTAAAAGLAAKGLATELLGVVAPAIITGLEGITTFLAAIKHLAAGGNNELANIGEEILSLEKDIARAENNGGMMNSIQQDYIAGIRAQIAVLKEKEQALIDAPMKEAQARIAAAKIAPAPAEELADIVVVGKAKTKAILDVETERHLVLLEARGKMLAELEDQLRTHENTLSGITLVGLNEREAFQAQSHQAQAKTIFGELAGITAGVAQHNKALFQINKAAGIANAIIATYEGVSQSLKAYPMPLAGIMAAVHLAAGIANVMAIKNQQFNGGGAGSAPSNTTAVPTPTTPAGGGQGGGGGGASGGVLRVEGMGADQLFTGKFVRGLAERLAEHQKDGGTVLFS